MSQHGASKHMLDLLYRHMLDLLYRHMLDLHVATWGKQKRFWLCGDVSDVWRGETLYLLYRHMLDLLYRHMLYLLYRHMRGLPSSSQHVLT